MLTLSLTISCFIRHKIYILFRMQNDQPASSSPAESELKWQTCFGAMHSTFSCTSGKGLNYCSVIEAIFCKFRNLVACIAWSIGVAS